MIYKGKRFAGPRRTSKRRALHDIVAARRAYREGSRSRLDMGKFLIDLKSPAVMVDQNDLLDKLEKRCKELCGEGVV